MSTPATAADAVAFPPMCTADLDVATLDRLFSDLDTCAEVSEVLLKTGARAMVAPRSVSLGEAQRALADGSVRAVQVRYRHDGREWSDTLLRTPGGVRLVRCQVPM